LAICCSAQCVFACVYGCFPDGAIRHSYPQWSVTLLDRRTAVCAPWYFVL